MMLFNFFGGPKPFMSGYLPEENGHLVFYAQYGNPNGDPVLHFHGGPGSNSKAKHASLFDLKKHRVILFDQRGCGKSLPTGETGNNATADLLRDAKRLLNGLNITQTNLYGGSWGATLALLFAEKHPERIRKMVICQTFLARQKDIEWMVDGTRHFYPDIMAVLQKTVPPGTSLRRHYADLIFSDNEADRLASTRLYGNYEHMIGKLNPSFPVTEPTPDHMRGYSMFMHYDRQDYGVGENEILQNIGVIENLPALILHNRMDLLCPVEQAWELHQALRNSKLVIVPDYGHSSDLLRKTSIMEIAAFL